MTELCCQFGEYRQLAGILTEPATPTHTACVLVNAGLVPKSGPYRLYVDLARRLARDGVVTLRFDLGGIGDSRQALSNQPLKERTLVEIRAAVDEVRRRYPDLRNLVLGGLCSGAEDGFRYAELDPRVTGVVLLDPFSYRTAGWQWRYLVHRAVRRTLRSIKLYEPIVPPRGPTKVVNYKYMEHAESSRILKEMIARKARVHFVYTGGQQTTFNHVRQLDQMFKGIPLEGRVTLDYFRYMDHTQLLDEDRKTVANAIGTWLTPR